MYATRTLTSRYDAWRSGRISFGEFDASVQGWVNHVRYADTWGLREHVLSPLSWGPAESSAILAEKKFPRPRSAWSPTE